MRNLLSILQVLLLALLVGCSTAPLTPTQDGLMPSGSFAVRESQALRLAVGNAGEGTLMFQGWQYPFILENAKVGIDGNNPVEIIGSVFNLQKIEDFEGKYTLTKADIETGEGISGLEAKNENGVVLHVSTQGHDVAIDAEATGLEITLK